MKKISLIILFSSIVGILHTQELNCKVSLNSDRIAGSNKQLFSTLQNAITEFLNTTQWTDLTFASNERIECSLFILVNSVENDIFRCEMTCQSRRPVYNSNYFTTVLNLKDDYFTFKYSEFDRIEYNLAHFENNISALLSFYAFLILGYDMDTYSRCGGTPYFQRCEDIAFVAQSAAFESTEQTGWRAFESNKNRYAIINNLMDEAFKPLREYSYTYHRLALDQMAQNVANAREKIVAAMPALKDAYTARPNSYVVNIFLDAKEDELVSLLKKGTNDEKKQAYDILTTIAPTKQKQYEKILK